MKWLLPEPNDPARNAPRLTRRQRLGDQSERRQTPAERRRDHILVDRAGDSARLDAVGQPQHVILGTRLHGMSSTSRTNNSLMSYSLPGRARARRAGRHAVSSSSVLPTWAAGR